LFGIVHALYKSRTTKGAKKMQTILNFFRKQETTKKVHTYTKAVTESGVYAKREDGVEYFISSDLLN
jgi:hypothetical protein